jgi:ubiquinone/menaquinone biosynthesis C-methylase UbiE
VDTTNEARHADTGQSALWNGSAGRAWVDAQPALDAMFEPFEARLVEAVAARRPRRVLDVGCGTGATTLAIARQLGPASQCMGVDISAPMIDVARLRGADAAARFIRADAQDHIFDAPRFDRIVSRFGVMFFADPVAAFANLRRAATDDAQLHFFAWRSAAENPFMTAAERIAHRWLPHMLLHSRSKVPTDAPGQFAFADGSRVRNILETSGWTDIVIEPVDEACRFPASALRQYITQMGPLGRALQQVDAPARERIVDGVSAAFARYLEGDDVRFDAACWEVSARSTRAAKGNAR